MIRSRTLRRVVALCSAMAIVMTVAVPGAIAKPPEGGPARDNAKTTEVQILALNDFHGQLRPPDSTSSGGRIGATAGAGGAEFLAQYVRDLEATNPNTLFVSAGDVIGATPLVSAIFHDEPTIEAMNLMGLDYNGVGNHEFDEGPEELTRMQEGGCHPVEGCFGGDGFDGRRLPVPRRQRDLQRHRRDDLPAVRHPRVPRRRCGHRRHDARGHAQHRHGGGHREPHLPRRGRLRQRPGAHPQGGRDRDDHRPPPRGRLGHDAAGPERDDRQSVQRQHRLEQPRSSTS